MSEKKITKEIDPEEVLRKTVNDNGQVYLGRHLGGKDVYVAYEVIEVEEE